MEKDATNMEKFDATPVSSASPYAEAEAYLAPLDADRRVVIYVNTRHGTGGATFGANGGIAVSDIREVSSLRDFVVAQLARHRFNGPRGDSDRIDEDQIDSIIIEDYC